MIERIDCLLPKGGHKELADYTYKLGDALKYLGVEIKFHDFSTFDPGAFFREMKIDPPDLTLSFNGLLPDGEGRFLCDMIEVPHLACLNQSAPSFILLKESDLNWIACCDKTDIALLKGWNFDQTTFLPMGFDKKLLTSLPEKKEFDFSLIGLCVDIEAIDQEWQKLYSPRMNVALHHTVDIVLRDPASTYWEAFWEAINIHVPTQKVELATTVTLFEEIERYVMGKAEIDFLIHSKHLKIDVFGEVKGVKSWSHYLKGCDHIALHPVCSYEDENSVIARSKFLLQINPYLRQGCKSALFKAYALHTLPISSENAFLSEMFHDEKAILYARWGSWQHTEEKILKAHLDADLYHSMLIKGRNLAARHHTWDHRAQTLLPFLNKSL